MKFHRLWSLVCPSLSVYPIPMGLGLRGSLLSRWHVLPAILQNEPYLGVIVIRFLVVTRSTTTCLLVTTQEASHHD